MEYQSQAALVDYQVTKSILLKPVVPILVLAGWFGNFKFFGPVEHTPACLPPPATRHGQDNYRL